MRKYIGALLLLAAGLMIASPALLAQDALSAVLPAPWENRVGTQVIYFYEDSGAAAPTGFKAFLTITNTSITTSVTVHIQVYTSGCQEVFDYIDKLTPADQHVIDPQNFKKNSGGAVIGAGAPGKFVVTITSVNPATTLSDRRVYSHNWLTGQQWQAHAGSDRASSVNAVSRMAVSSVGAALPDGTQVLGTAATGFLQNIKPTILLVNSFFAPASLSAGTPSGNRLSIISVSDNYSPADNTYRIFGTGVSLTNLVFDNKENPFSVPPRTVKCWSDFSIGIDADLANYTGSALNAAIASGGWLRMQPGATGNLLYGTFEQQLGKFGGRSYLVGIGRQGSTTLPILFNFNPATGVVTTGTTTQNP